MAVPAAEITAASKRRLIAVEHGVERFGQEMVDEAPVMIAALTHLLEAEVGAEFVRSGHDRSNDTSREYPPGYVHTIDTLTSEAGGLTGVVEMAGGAPYIEFGTESHFVAPVTAQALHWQEGGEDFFSKGHEVSGIEADDFAGRAIEAVDAEAVLASVFSKSFLAIFDRED